MINKLQNSHTKSMMQKKIMTVLIDEINPNKLNQFPIEAIEELAENIKEVGLKQPLICYKRANHEYVLLNGERRFHALKILGIEEVQVIIVDKPKNELEERETLIDLNSQRDETQESKRARAKLLEEIYEEKKKLGLIQSNIHKRDWIGMKMNISGRQVSNLLNEDKNENTASPGKQVEKVEKKVSLEKILKNLEEKVSKINFNAKEMAETELEKCADSYKEIINTMLQQHNLLIDEIEYINKPAQKTNTTIYDDEFDLFGDVE